MPSSIEEWQRTYCGVGDCIEAAISDGRRIVVQLDTPEAVACANEFIMRGDGIWRKVQPIDHARKAVEEHG